jgi:hypothetical protein
MTVNSIATFTLPGVGTVGNGMLIASSILQNLTVIWSATGATGATLNVDLLLSDGTWVSALTTAIAAASGSGSQAVINGGVATAARLNVGGISAGSLKAQLVARDIN